MSSAKPVEYSLLWISLDTVRADHLQLYGYTRDTSPFLKELAQRGLYFEWAVSPQNSTLPTHITQFTGVHPFVHGVMHSRRNPGVRLADSVRTLPEVLAAAGFRTRAWTGGGKMDRHYGFARGFDRYQHLSRPLSRKLRRVLRALDRLEDGERFFFFVHTYQAHAPYQPPLPYRDRYREPNPPGYREEMNKYDASIRFIDDELRGFVGELERRGILARTVLVITGDHGESFNEYGIANVGHGADNLHQNLTRVPWIVLHPSGRYRGRIAKLVGLVDFANTTLAMLGIEERLGGDGADVLASDAPNDRSYVSWTGLSPDCAWSVFSGDYHLLTCTDLAGPERNGVYDTRLDPLERRMLDAPGKTAELEARLARRRHTLVEERDRRQASMMDFAPLQKETIDALRALGYLEGPDDGAERP